MKLFTTKMIIISALVVSSMLLTPSTALLASSKGLKLYLTIDTNLNDDVRINMYQYGDRIFTHDAVIHSDSNKVTLQYPNGLIDTGEFRICVRPNNYDELACGTGYNSEAKQPDMYLLTYLQKKTEAHPMLIVIIKRRARVKIMNKARAKTTIRTNYNDP